MAVSDERLNELYALYNEIKRRCQVIDNKYSLDTVPPDLDMPESLNLQKLVYTPQTEEQLRAAAEQSIAATVLSKQRSIEKTYSSKLKSLSLQKDKLLADADAKLNAALADFNAEKEEIARKLVDNGLVFSTVGVKYNKLASDRYNEQAKTISAYLLAEQKALTTQETDAQQLYDESCASLDEEKQARIDEAYRKLTEKEEKERISVEKYNNSLEEKEQRYQATRAKAYESAWRAQQNMALQNAKTYAELGETGYRDLIQREKYGVCTQAFSQVNREEANTMLSFDGFLRSSLGSYYSAFVNWINTVLLPA